MLGLENRCGRQAGKRGSKGQAWAIMQAGEASEGARSRCGHADMHASVHLSEAAAKRQGPRKQRAGRAGRAGRCWLAASCYRHS